ncbi:MAG: PAS-domain containing protein [Kiloniellales bacterium]|nr:PAS-domain containing protein [Kiloniellales bacterium]
MSQDEPDQPASANRAEHEQALLDFAVSQSPAIFYIADLNGAKPIRFISSNVEKLTGHAPEAFLSDPGYGRRFIHPEDRDAYQARLEELRESGAASHEYRFATTSGDYRWFRDELRRIEVSQADEEFVGCMIDITAEKQVARLLHDAVESLPTGFAVYDKEGRLILANQALALAQTGEKDKDPANLVGLPREEIILRVLPITRSIDGRKVTPDRATAKALDRHIGELENATLEIELADGRWRLMSCHPTSEGGQITYGTDITDQKRREAELRQTREILEDAVESLSEGFVLWDGDDRLVTCNSQYRAFNPMIQDLLVRGAKWEDLARARAERGQFQDAVGRLDAWLAERVSERGRVLSNQFQLTDGRWFEDSHRRTREGGLVTTWREITEQRAMEVALRENEALIRRILDACPLPVRMWNWRSGQVIYESPACSQLFQVDGTKLTIEERATAYVNPADRKHYHVRLQEDGSIDNMETELRRRDGTTFWAAISARLIDYKGEPAVVSSIVDLTEQKTREAELRQARETLDDAIESLSEGLALYDSEDRLVLCNSQYKRFHGDSEDLLVPGTPWREVTRRRGERGLFVEAAGQLEEWLEGQMAQRGKAQHEEFPFQGDRWFEYSHRPTRQGGFVSTWRDVSERKAMEQALRESEDLLRRVLNVCPLPVTMYQVEDSQVVYENPAAEELFGQRTPGSERPSRWLNVEERGRYVQRLHEKGILDGVEVQYRRADGSPFWGALSARLIDYKGEDVVVASVFDLTDRREVEEEMARQRELLHQSEKLSALGELLAGVAHELNNPLSVLVGQAALLRETSKDEATAKRAEKIGNAAERCARIVRTFLAMARQRPGQVKAVDLNEIIVSALEVTAYSLRSSGVEVTLNLDEALPRITADGDQLRQVVTNLVVNADHALQDVTGARKLSISSELRRGKGQAVIEVKDNGPGIPPELRRRIFEPLFTTKATGSGTGIGLALCHRIIEAHGGTIALESQAGQGACFSIRLPIVPVVEMTKADQSRPDWGARPCRVMVIDDEIDVAELIAEVLREDGHEVELASSGETALARITDSAFDLVLSDIRMPGMDGPRLFQAVVDSRPELAGKVAFITGDTMSTKVRSFLDNSGCHYIEKPITPSDLRHLVRSMAEASRPSGA